MIGVFFFRGGRGEDQRQTATQEERAGGKTRGRQRDKRSGQGAQEEERTEAGAEKEEHNSSRQERQ